MTKWRTMKNMKMPKRIPQRCVVVPRCTSPLPILTYLLLFWNRELLASPAQPVPDDQLALNNDYVAANGHDTPARQTRHSAANSPASQPSSSAKKTRKHHTVLLRESDQPAAPSDPPTPLFRVPMTLDFSFASKWLTGCIGKLPLSAPDKKVDLEESVAAQEAFRIQMAEDMARAGPKPPGSAAVLNWEGLPAESSNTPAALSI